jgi:hypothetical protein
MPDKMDDAIGIAIPSCGLFADYYRDCHFQLQSSLQYAMRIVKEKQTKLPILFARIGHNTIKIANRCF